MSIAGSSWDRRLQQVGGVVLRYSLALIFLAFGLLKFTPAEAASIQPLGAHSPVLFWLYAVGTPQTASDVIGVIEISLALAISARRFAPAVSAAGSLGTTFALMTTLSFLVTTPHLDSDYQGFILKDLTLLGAALWSAGEALQAAGARRTPSAVPAEA